jgi:hypothetical protein
MNASKTQPALIGGVVLGVLSALPVVSAGNLCCCLWVVSGGVVAAYLLQQNQAAPITPGDGALVGLLAGITGAFVYLLLSIPITMLVAPMERTVLRRIIETTGNMPPEFREYARGFVGGGIRLAIGFVLMLSVGSTCAALGGLLGAVVFRKPLSPATVDVPPPA